MAKYRVQDDQCGKDFEEDCDADALEYGEAWMREGERDRSETLFLQATVHRLDDEGEVDYRLGTVHVDLPPEEPKCSGGSHAWCAPYELLGGMEENPGVFGHGGGVRIKEVCKRCGTGRLTDTWATNPCDGTQGHETVEYSPAGEEERKWVAQQHEEVSDESA